MTSVLSTKDCVGKDIIQAANGIGDKYNIGARVQIRQSETYVQIGTQVCFLMVIFSIVHHPYEDLAIAYFYDNPFERSAICQPACITKRSLDSLVGRGHPELHETNEDGKLWQVLWLSGYFGSNSQFGLVSDTV